MRVAILGFLLFASLVLLATEAVIADSNALPIIADKVLVNKTGGITVSGTMACAEAVSAYDWTDLGGSLGVPPKDLTILLNVSWTAYQPVGRKTMLQATFGSSHKDPCYNTDDDQPSGTGGTLTEPCRWISSNINSTSTPFYVYSPQGKFVPGRIHVDIFSGDPDGWIVIGGELQCESGGTPVSCESEGATPRTVNIFQFSGYDRQASRTR